MNAAGPSLENVALRPEGASTSTTGFGRDLSTEENPEIPELLDRHRFGEVTRLVNVRAFYHRGVVR